MYAFSCGRASVLAINWNLIINFGIILWQRRFVHTIVILNLTICICSAPFELLCLKECLQFLMVRAIVFFKLETYGEG